MTPATNLLAFAVLVSTLLLVWRRSWLGRVRLFMAQSAVLALLATVLAVLGARPTLLLVATAVVVVKAWIIPRVLVRMAAGLPARPAGPGRAATIDLLVAAALVVVAYLVMLPVTGIATLLPTSRALPLAMASAFIGLLLCVRGRDVLGQILGFLVFENGVFTLALLATWGLPGLVEAGVFLDVLVIVLLMEGVVVEIRREHDSTDIERLRELRG